MPWKANYEMCPALKYSHDGKSFVYNIFHFWNMKQKNVFDLQLLKHEVECWKNVSYLVFVNK